LLLTGCTPDDSDAGDSNSAPAAEEQTVKEACTALIDGLSEMQATLTENSAELQSDPAAAAEAYETVVALFQENSAKVTNADVKPVADEIEAVFVDFSSTIEAAATDPASVDPQAYTDYSTDLTEATTALDDVCSAG
jgi:hypothetical protein